MPLFRRLAKRGFSTGDSARQKWIAIVNVGALSKLASDVFVVSSDVLIAAGLIPRRSRVVRVLGGGELSRAFTIEADYVSRSAHEKVQAAGGKVVLK